MSNSLSVVHALDEKVIYDNMEYKNLTKQLAQAFNDMWTKCIKRYTDFFAERDSLWNAPRCGWCRPQPWCPRRFGF